MVEANAQRAHSDNAPARSQIRRSACQASIAGVGFLAKLVMESQHTASNRENTDLSASYAKRAKLAG